MSTISDAQEAVIAELDRVTRPMGSDEYEELLQELNSDIDARLECLKEERENEDGD